MAGSIVLKPSESRYIKQIQRKGNAVEIIGGSSKNISGFGSGGGGSSSTSSNTNQRVESSRADIQRQQALASSKSNNQKLAEATNILKKNPKESQASFQARQESLGRAIRQSSPIEANRYLNQFNTTTPRQSINTSQSFNPSSLSSVGFTPTNQTQKSNLQLATERADRLRAFNFTSSDFIARTDTGGISTPGTIAKSFLTAGEFVSAQLRLDKTNLPGSRTTFSGQKATKIGSDIVTFTAFSPLMPTTTQIFKETQPTEAIVSETIRKKTPETTVTDFEFVTTKGRTSKLTGKPIFEEKGVGTAVSKTIRNSGKSSLTDTAVYGGTYRGSLNIPSGSTLKPTSRFVSRQLGVSREVEKEVTSDILSPTQKSMFSVTENKPFKESFNFGRTTVKRGLRKNDIYFLGKNIGIEGEKGSFVYQGITRTGRQGLSRATGFIRTKPTATEDFIKTTGGGGKLTPNIIQKGSLTPEIKSAVSSALTKQEFSVTPTIKGGLNIKGISTPNLKPQVQKSVTKQNLVQIPTTTQATNFKFLSGQLGGQAQKTRTRQKTRLAQLPKLDILERQKTRQTQRLAQPLKLKQPQRQKTKAVSTFIPTPTFTPIISPPSFLLPKSKSSSLFGKTKRKSKPPKRLPSLFAIGRGIKSSSRGIGESSGLTIRPILTPTRRRRVVKRKPVRRRR